MPANASLVVASDKASAFHWWLQERAVPSSVGFFHSRCIADPRVVAVAGRMLPAGASIVFVGDLDTPALVRFAELKRIAPFRSRLHYGGIDSRWLAAIEAKVPRVRIPLAAEERRVLPSLERALPLERLVGIEAAHLLRSGFKIELEGATNPHLYSASHHRWIFRTLRQAARGR